MYEQATIAPVDKEALARVQQSLRQIFSPARAADFLHSVAKAGCSVRDFSSVLQKGLLGTGARVDFPALPESDKGQVRELYLSLVEQVDPKLRQKFMKVYTMY
jgi:hypothetical protein